MDRRKRTDRLERSYREHRGILVRKYRDLFGRYVLVISEAGVLARVRVGKHIYNRMAPGVKLTVGKIRGKLVNIRPGLMGTPVYDPMEQDRRLRWSRLFSFRHRTFTYPGLIWVKKRGMI